MFNLVEQTQKNLGFPVLNKIDPNTQDVKTEGANFGSHSQAQAAIPAVVYGVCHRLINPESAAGIINGKPKGSWMELIFGEKKQALLDRMYKYAATKSASMDDEAEHIAAEVVRLVKSKFPVHEDQALVRNFAVEEKNNALFYLPGSLELGSLLGDDQLDDSTHKMEGPVSGLMHAIEKQF